MKKLLILLFSITLSLNAFSSYEVAMNSLRCSAMFYVQTAIEEKAESSSQFSQIFNQIYLHHFEEYSGENLTYGDLSNARGQAVLQVATEYSVESEGDYILAKEFRHCAYWLQDIGLYFSTIEIDFPEIHTAESALQERQMFLSIPMKSSTTNFEDDLHLWDDQLLNGFYLWTEMGAPLSFSEQLEKMLDSKK